jgi:Holliday junction resolvase RusA-like endonuclease
MDNNKNIIKLSLTQDVVDDFNNYYRLCHPKSKKKAIEHPYHPSINQWMILNNLQLNTIKQKWKEMIVYWLRNLGYQNTGLTETEMTFTTYMPSKRRVDCDNTVPKFILDGFTEAGFIVDDDGEHLKSLTLKTGYDKDNPRTDIEVRILNNDFTGLERETQK